MWQETYSLETLFLDIDQSTYAQKVMPPVSEKELSSLQQSDYKLLLSPF